MFPFQQQTKPGTLSCRVFTALLSLGRSRGAPTAFILSNISEIMILDTLLNDDCLDTFSLLGKGDHSTHRDDFMQYLPDWTTLILTVLLPPLVLALTLSANSFFPGVPVINDDKQGKTKLPALKEMLK